MYKIIATLVISFTLIVPSSIPSECFAKLLYHPADPGWIYYLKRTSSKFHNMISGSHYINRTRDNATLVSKIAYSVTLGATANCSLSGGWGPVNAAIGYTANRSETWTKEDAITITIRPGDEGWNDYGVKRDTWIGKCVYQTERGKEINPQYVTITSPRYKVVVAKTRKVR